MSNIGSANAIIIWKDTILLFHRDDIQSIPYPDYWSLPGGGIEPGETPLEAVIRELHEEVNHAPSQLKQVFHHQLKNHKTLTVYYSEVGDEEASLFRHNPGEGQEIAFVPFKDLGEYKIPEFFKAGLQKHPQKISEFLSTKNHQLLTEIFHDIYA